MSGEYQKGKVLIGDKVIEDVISWSYITDDQGRYHHIEIITRSNKYMKYVIVPPYNTDILKLPYDLKDKYYKGELENIINNI